MKTNKTQSKETKDNTVQMEDWDASSFLLLLLKSFGVEIISKDGLVPSVRPVFINCGFEAAMKISKNAYFSVELCGDEIWGITLTDVDNTDPVESSMRRWFATNRLEEPTYRAENWVCREIDKIVLKEYE